MPRQAGAVLLLATSSLATNICCLDGDLYVADTFNNAIRRFARDHLSTVAGGSGRGFQDGVGQAASFFMPRGIAAHDQQADTLFVAEGGNAAIRVVTPSTRQVTTLLMLDVRLIRPTGLHVRRGMPFVADEDEVLEVDLSQTPTRRASKVSVASISGLASDAESTLFGCSHKHGGSIMQAPLRTSGSGAPRREGPLSDCDGAPLSFGGRPQGLAYLASSSRTPCADAGMLLVADYDATQSLRFLSTGVRKGRPTLSA